MEKLQELTQVPTVAEVELMKSGELVAAWNRLAVPLGQVPVKKFATRADGVRRLRVVIEVVMSAAQRGEPKVEPAVVKTAAEALVKAKAPARVREGVRGAVVKSGGTLTKKPVKAASEPKVKKSSFASRVRELDAAGRDKDAIWKILQPEFDMPDTKKWFVGWYIADAKRRARRG